MLQFIVLAANLLLAFLGKTRPTLTPIGYVALHDASLTCLVMLVKGQKRSQRDKEQYCICPKKENFKMRSVIFIVHMTFFCYRFID